LISIACAKEQVMIAVAKMKKAYRSFMVFAS
jgi:hypothetical protein